jgi:methylated-DNA-[protein]-cysteine S-methyltransferase
MMKLYCDTFPTPFGDFSVAVDENGTVVATTFGNEADLRARLASDELLRQPGYAAEARREITGFLRGELREFTVKTVPRGTDFQKRVWSALRHVHYGRTCTYGELAAAVGNPKAARAVGRTNAANPVCPIVPCHRCIGADGSLTGFGFGEAIKQRLLDLESKTR